MHSSRILSVSSRSCPIINLLKAVQGSRGRGRHKLMIRLLAGPPPQSCRDRRLPPTLLWLVTLARFWDQKVPTLAPKIFTTLKRWQPKRTSQWLNKRWPTHNAWAVGNWFLQLERFPACSPPRSSKPLELALEEASKLLVRSRLIGKQELTNR